MLVLVDQHAADERIRVERFLKELGEGFMAGSISSDNVQDVDPTTRGIALHLPSEPTFILLTRSEYLHLVQRPDFLLAFTRWGIHLRPPPFSTSDGDVHRQPQGDDEGGSTFVQIPVLAVPKIVAGRLLGRRSLGEGPKELTDLVKEVIATLKVDGPDGLLAASSSAAGVGASEGEGEDKGMKWLQVMRFCPRGLLDLINSKACRGWLPALLRLPFMF